MTQKSTPASWLLFSMHDIPGIKYFLSDFPRAKNLSPGSQGCSATLVWSGEQGLNIPVHPFHNQAIGFVLDPHLIEVPQADLVADQSFSKLEKEKLKHGAKNTWLPMEDDTQKFTTIIYSKYPEKIGYRRLYIKEALPPFGGAGKKFTTNLARYDCLLKVTMPKGSAELFAKNIRYKYFKAPKSAQHPQYVVNGIMKLNEAIVFQKKKLNPISGLIITETPEPNVAKELLQILESHVSLKLYLYDKTATAHIVRWVDNKQAQAFLKNNLDFKIEFEKASFYTETNVKPKLPHLATFNKRPSLVKSTHNKTPLPVPLKNDKKAQLEKELSDDARMKTKIALKDLMPLLDRFRGILNTAQLPKIKPVEDLTHFLKDNIKTLSNNLQSEQPDHNHQQEVLKKILTSLDHHILALDEAGKRYVFPPSVYILCDFIKKILFSLKITKNPETDYTRERRFVGLISDQFNFFKCDREMNAPDYTSRIACKG